MKVPLDSEMWARASSAAVDVDEDVEIDEEEPVQASLFPELDEQQDG